MYRLLLFGLIVVSCAADLLGIVVLNPAPFDRSAPVTSIDRNPLRVSYSGGEGASMNTARGTLILTITSRPETLLQQAVVDHDIERVRQLLVSHEDPNVQNHHGFTALHFAAALGYVDLVNLLLSYKANPNIHDDLVHATPLHLSCHAAQMIDVVKLLVRYKADVTQSDIYGYTALHTAAVTNAQDIAKLLLEAGANSNAATFKTTQATMQSRSALRMSTPLHEAAMYGYSDVVQLLLKHGANLKSQTIDSKTPMHLALSYGQASVIHLLLQRGCSLEGAPEQSLVQAAFCGDYELVKLLIIDGFDINQAITEKAKDGDLTITPLCAACHNPHAYEIIQLLLEHNALVNLADSDGSTPLIHAIEKLVDTKTVTLLLEHGADVNQANNYGVTAAHVAAFLGKTDILQILQQHGANLNATTKQHKTPLQLAISRDHQETAEFLKSLEVQVIPKLQAREDRQIPTTVHDDKNAKPSTLLVDSSKEELKPSLLQQCYDVIQERPTMCIVGTMIAVYCIQDALRTEYKRITSFFYSR